MTKLERLLKVKTVEQFKSKYFYAAELRKALTEAGYKVTSLRKDQMESIIEADLSGSKGKKQRIAESLEKSANPKKTKASGVADKPGDTVRVVNYKNTKAIKDWIVQRAERIAPGYKAKSGEKYWLNRWRETQIENGCPITYKDLAEQLAKLRMTEGRLPEIPSCRFNNFISAFLADNAGSKKREAQAAWEALKKMEGVEKTYAAYKRIKNSL